ncbi:MAG: HPP family protein [Chloroflexi bacterium]|nr:HPP family protein [Chloroflexota bacterium]
MRICPDRLRSGWLLHGDRLFDAKARAHPWRYIAQCALAAVTIGATMLFLDALLHTEIIATLGATTFILFALPTSHAARPRALLGGYFWGIIAGAVCCALADHIPFRESALPSRAQDILFGGLAVGLAILGMVTTNTEHPPAAGVALGLVVRPWTMNTLLFVAAAVLLLAATHRALRRFLIDLA